MCSVCLKCTPRNKNAPAGNQWEHRKAKLVVAWLPKEAPRRPKAAQRKSHYWPERCLQSPPFLCRQLGARLAAKPPNLSLFAGSEIHPDLSQPLTETKNGNHLKKKCWYILFGVLYLVFLSIYQPLFGGILVYSQKPR